MKEGRRRRRDARDVNVTPSWLTKKLVAVTWPKYSPARIQWQIMFEIGPQIASDFICNWIEFKLGKFLRNWIRNGPEIALQLLWNCSPIELNSNWANFSSIDLKLLRNCSTTAPELLWNRTGTALELNRIPIRQISLQLIRNFSSMDPKLLRNCCTTAPDLLWNCSEIALKLLRNCSGF